MGIKAKTFHGSRCQVAINGKIVGIFNSMEYGQAFTSDEVSILGKESTAEIVITGQETVQVTLSGYKAIGNGPHVAASVPKLQEILQHEDVTLTAFDRTTGETVCTIVGFRPLGYNTGVAAKQLATLQVMGKGLRIMDESGDQDDAPGATIY